MNTAAANIESELSPPVVAGLAAVVARLLADNNADRQLAEADLNAQWKDRAPHLLLAGLASIATSHPEPQ
ncbi:hypothetical protein HDU84_009224, partial [Entophlyctis sp. JEL0112]